MTLRVKATDNNIKVQIKRILVPIDGSGYSFNAAKYAIKLAKDENAQLYCIHVMSSVPYGYESSPHAIDQYFRDLEQKVQSWFDKIKDMAKNECISDLNTETFTDVNSVIESIIDYAVTKEVDLIVIGTRGSVANGVVQRDNALGQVPTIRIIFSHWY